MPREAADYAAKYRTLSLALSPRLHIRCTKKSAKDGALCKRDKKEPETLQFPAFSVK